MFVQLINFVGGSRLKFMDVLVEKSVPINPRVNQEPLWKLLQNRDIPFAMTLVCKPKKVQGFWKLKYGPLGAVIDPKTMTEDQLRICIEHILRCLMNLHKAGWVHRDIRWANIVLGPDGCFYLIDFDLAVHNKEAIAKHHASVPPDAKTRVWEFKHDLWQVGELIRQVFTKSALATDLANKLQDGTIESAEAALGHAWFQVLLF